MRRKKRDREVWNALVMVFQFGINMIVPIVLCVFLGIWISDKTGIKWVIVPLFFMGALAGGTNIYRIVKKMISDAERESGTGMGIDRTESDTERRKD